MKTHGKNWEKQGGQTSRAKAAGHSNCVGVGRWEVVGVRGIRGIRERLGGLHLSAGGVARDLRGVRKKFAWLESLSSAGQRAGVIFSAIS